MAGYSAVIDLRVNGLDGLRTVEDTVASINRLIKQVKPVPTLFDKRADSKIQEAKKNLADLVKAYADGGNRSAAFSTSVAGLNQQLTTFRAVAANAKTGSDQFTNSLKAAELVTNRLNKAELERLNTVKDLYTRRATGGLTAEDQGPSGLTKNVLALGKQLPTSIAGLRAYSSELDRVFNLVEAGSVDFRALQAEIARVNAQLDIATGAGPIQGPALPPGMRPGAGKGPVPKSPIGGGPGFPGSPGAKAALFENLALGAGFPLLFGGGAGQVAGGLLGSFVGTGFGGQILGSAIGQQLEDATRRITEIGTALNELNMDALRDSVILVNSELTNQVRLLQEAGRADQARAVIAKEVTLQTGLLPEAVSDITNNTNLLGNTWNEFTGAVSGTLAILGGPFASALTFILQGLAKALQGINFIATGAASILNRTVEWAAKTLGLGDLLSGIQDQTKAISEEEEKRVATLQQLTDGQLKEILNNQKNLKLEAQRTLGRTAAEKQINAEIDRQLANEKIRIEYADKAKQLRQDYANVTSEAGKRELELALASNEALKQQALEQQKIKDLLVEQGIAAQTLKEQQDQVTKGIQDSITGIDKSAGVAAAALDRQASIAQAYLSTEKQITDVLLEQANRRLTGAKTQQQRIAAAKDIYNLTVRQAKIEYQINTAAIEAEVSKARLAAEAAAQKVKQVEAAVLLAKAEDRANDEHYKALNAIKDALELSQIQYRTTTEIAHQQQRAAEAVYNGKVQAAEATYQTQRLSTGTQAAASAAGQYATNMQIAASSAASAAGAVRSLQDVQAGIRTLNRTTTQVASYTEDEMRMMGIGPYANAATRATYQAQKAADRLAAAQSTTATTATPVAAFARGGLVTKPTIALIGEGGENEYVVPQSKATDFAFNHLTSNRGGGFSPNLNISIQTGPVTQMNGTNYVTTEDLGEAIRSSVDQTLSLLSGDSSVRRSVGIG